MARSCPQPTPKRNDVDVMYMGSLDARDAALRADEVYAVVGASCCCYHLLGFVQYPLVCFNVFALVGQLVLACHCLCTSLFILSLLGLEFNILPPVEILLDLQYLFEPGSHFKFEILYLPI